MTKRTWQQRAKIIERLRHQGVDTPTMIDVDRELSRPNDVSRSMRVLGYVLWSCVWFLAGLLAGMAI